MRAAPSTVPQLTDADKARFFSKINKPDNRDGCHTWTAGKVWGYGIFSAQGRLLKAHRVAYTLANPDMDSSLCVLHKCDVRACVNPAHLFIGTKADNVRDMVNKDRGAKGEKNASAKLTEAQAVEIFIAYHRDKQTQSSIAAKYEVSEYPVWAIIHGRNWKHVTNHIKLSTP